MNNTVTSSNSHAVLAAEIARLREAILEAVQSLTLRVDHEPWSDKIATVVPMLREALK